VPVPLVALDEGWLMAFSYGPVRRLSPCPERQSVH
jgi:hypothetical protein